VRVSTAVVLPAARERAWDVLLRWEEQPRWMRDADSVRVVSPGRSGVGVRIAVRTRVLGVPLFTEILEVVAWEPPGRLVMAHRGFVRGTGEWRLEPFEGGTRFMWTEELSIPVPLLGEMALLAYQPFLRRLMRDGLAGLQSLLAEAT